MADERKSTVYKAEYVEEVEVIEIPHSEPEEGKRDWSIAWIILAILYIISPLDFLPEALLGPLGLADDAAALVFLVKMLYDKLKK